jgi:hypothetical protein
MGSQAALVGLPGTAGQLPRQDACRTTGTLEAERRLTNEQDQSGRWRTFDARAKAKEERRKSSGVYAALAIYGGAVVFPIDGSCKTTPKKVARCARREAALPRTQAPPNCTREIVGLHLSRGLCFCGTFSPSRAARCVDRIHSVLVSICAPALNAFASWHWIQRCESFQRFLRPVFRPAPASKPLRCSSSSDP